MNISLSKFAEVSSGGGISALGINWKSFVFQLISFLLVLWLLSKFAFPKLISTLEARRETLEKSLDQARQTEEALRSAEEKASHVLRAARDQADEAIDEARKKAEELISKAEVDGAAHAVRIIKEAEAHLHQERIKMRTELRKELATLVSTTTEKFLREKLDADKDLELIEKQVKELSE